MVADIPIGLIKLLGVSGTQRRVALVSCGSAKRSLETEARYLYSSRLFQNSLFVANAVADDVFILSAKHGLVCQCEPLKPYEFSLKQMRRDEREAWGKSVAAALKRRVPIESEIVLFAGSAYKEPLISALAGSSFEIVDPLERMPIGKRSAKVLRMRRILHRANLAKHLYLGLEQQIKSGAMAPLSEVLARRNLPSRGLYLICDPAERSELMPGMPRLVRVGTHAVSIGSNSTLSSRLRAHRGTQGGGGAHRSSVFRLHIGQSMIDRDALRNNYPFWGRGSSAHLDVRLGELGLEKSVSNYIGELLVFVMPVLDEPSSQSLRAQLERALIALFTEGMDFVERPGDNWLGRLSSRPQISDSGLWNVQHVGAQMDDRYVRLALELIGTSQ